MNGMMSIFAQEVPELPTYGFTPDLAGLLSVVIAVLLPVFIGLITRASTNAGLKGMLLLGVASVKVIIEAWLTAVNTNVDFEFVPVVISVLLNFVIAVAVHYGLWKPTGVTAVAQRTLITERTDHRA